MRIPFEVSRQAAIEPNGFDRSVPASGGGSSVSLACHKRRSFTMWWLWASIMSLPMRLSLQKH